jgi:hypothetical protein
MILIIPLSLIITSFFHENRILQLFATWFSFGGSIFAVFFGVFNRTLLDNINLKFFRITHLLSLQEKQELFKEKFQIIANILGETSENKLNFILKHLNTINQKSFDNELIQFKTISDIDNYAFTLCSSFSSQYDTMVHALSLTRVKPLILTF